MRQMSITGRFLPVRQSRQTPGQRIVRFIYILLLYPLVSAGIANASDSMPDSEHWEAVAVTPAGQIYHRGFVDSAVPMVMIATTFKADVARVHAVVTDYDHFSDFIPNVVESRILLREGDVQWVFHHLRFPGPVADRVYVIKSTSTGSLEETDYRVEWQLAQRQFPGINPPKSIRPRVLSGFWELRSAADASLTEARYAVHSDPGGMIPAWLVEKMTDRYVQQVTEAIRKRLLSR